MKKRGNGWQVKPLGEVAKLIRGVTYSKEFVQRTPMRNYVPIIRANNIDEYLNFDDLVYVPSKFVKQEQLIRKNDILLAMSSGSKNLVGKAAQATAAYEIAFGTFCGLIRVTDKSLLYPEYLGFVFKSINYRKYISNCSEGANINNLRREHLLDFTLPLPPLPIQKQIAEILEKANQAKQKRKEANKLTEQFLQSAFIEMFGDPVGNPKGWKKVFLSEVADIERVSIQSCDLLKNDLYIGLEHIEKDTGILLGFERVDQIDLKSNKFKFSSTHILYGKLRPYLNKVCIPNFNGICSTDIIPIKPKKDISDKYFLAYLFRHESFVKEATSKSAGANLPRISPNILEKFMVNIPPLSLQQQFAELVQITEALKEKQKASEKELENLFNSLMQKAFKGELEFAGN